MPTRLQVRASFPEQPSASYVLDPVAHARGCRCSQLMLLLVSQDKAP